MFSEQECDMYKIDKRDPSYGDWERTAASDNYGDMFRLFTLLQINYDNMVLLHIMQNLILGTFLIRHFYSVRLVMLDGSRAFRLTFFESCFWVIVT